MRSWRQRLGLATLGIFILGMWSGFAPTALGGNVTYIILTGNSMAPDFYRDDLVLVRSQAYYRLGERVAYRHPDIGLVFHRITGLDESGRFILQGDNNTWQDSYHPLAEDIVGRFWLRIPRVGGWLRVMRSPVWMAVLSLLISGLFFWSFYDNTGKRTMRTTNQRLDALFFLGVLLVGSLLLGVVAFRTPTQVLVPEKIGYRQQAVLSYQAYTSPGVYDTTQLQAGEPIFSQLNDGFAARVHYRLQSTAVAEVGGTYRLLARVRDDTGWKRTMELQPWTPFQGTEFVAEGWVDLEQVESFIVTLEEKTGFRANRYFLDIVLEVNLAGRLGGRSLVTSFTPRFRLQYTPLAVYLYDDPFADGNPLQVVQEGFIAYDVARANTLTVLGVSVPVKAARMFSLGAGILALLALLWTGNSIYQESRRSALAYVQLWHGGQIVQVRAANFLRQHPWVEVTNFADLAALAEQHGRPVLYLAEGRLHHFFVQGEGYFYHFSMADLPVIEKDSLEIARHLPAWLRPSAWQQMESAYWQTLTALVDAWDSQVYDGGHARRVAEMAQRLAEALGLSAVATETVYRAAYLHDWGLRAVPEEILLKPTALNEDELALLRGYSAQLPATWAAIPDWEAVFAIVAAHRERWDGSGYPQGLVGEAIPLGARIVAVAEVWDALLHPRPHRSPWRAAEALDYFCSQRGRLFDPSVVDALCALQGKPIVQAVASSADSDAHENVDDETVAQN